MSRRTTQEQEFTDFFGAHAPGLRRTAYVVVRAWELNGEDISCE